MLNFPIKKCVGDPDGLINPRAPSHMKSWKGTKKALITCKARWSHLEAPAARKAFRTTLVENKINFQQFLSVRVELFFNKIAEAFIDKILMIHVGRK